MRNTYVYVPKYKKDKINNENSPKNSKEINKEKLSFFRKKLKTFTTKKV